MSNDGVQNDQAVFNGNFINSAGNLQNIDGSIPEEPGTQRGQSPFNGNFYGADGSIKNIDSISSGGGGVSSYSETILFEDITGNVFRKSSIDTASNRTLTVTNLSNYDGFFLYYSASTDSGFGQVPQWNCQRIEKLASNPSTIMQAYLPFLWIRSISATITNSICNPYIYVDFMKETITLQNNSISYNVINNNGVLNLAAATYTVLQINRIVGFKRG